MENLGRKTDNSSICRQPERNGGIKDLGIGAHDADRVDNPGIRTPDADGDKRANNLGGGANNSDTGR